MAEAPAGLKSSGGGFRVGTRGRMARGGAFRSHPGVQTGTRVAGTAQGTATPAGRRGFGFRPFPNQVGPAHRSGFAFRLGNNVDSVLSLQWQRIPVSEILIDPESRLPAFRLLFPISTARVGYTFAEDLLGPPFASLRLSFIAGRFISGAALLQPNFRWLRHNYLRHALRCSLCCIYHAAPAIRAPHSTSPSRN